MLKYLITGAKGQLGTELCKMMDDRGLEYDAFDAHQMDITDRDLTMKIINQCRPKVIFHCAAFTAVDAAEDEKKDLNWHVNVDGTRNVAEAAKAVGAQMVYISTDYVFDGTNEGEYQVDAPTNPKNEYGRAKLAGEEAVRQVLNDYYIIRTSWVFGKYGHNFVYTMLRLAQTHDKLTVVNDQVGRPTWTKTLAEFMLYLDDQQAAFGTYQLSNEDSCSWYEFAQAILQDKNVDVEPVTSEQYPQKAYRPRHSIMSLQKAEAIGFKIPSWQDALASMMKEIDL